MSICLMSRVLRAFRPNDFAWHLVVKFINVLRASFSYKILAPKITKLQEALLYKILAPKTHFRTKNVHAKC